MAQKKFQVWGSILIFLQVYLLKKGIFLQHFDSNSAEQFARS